MLQHYTSIVFILQLFVLSTTMAKSSVGARIIINGEEISINRYPFQVSLHARSRFICGGTLISSYYVLTAAHCTDLEGYNQYEVHVGSNDTLSGEIIQVEEVTQHPLFDRNNMDYDFAILKLSDAPSEDTVHSFVQLARPSDVIPDHSQVEIIGWGYTEEGTLAKTLRRTTTEKVNDQNCMTLYGMAYLMITPRMVCAHGHNTGSCFGDSGGPLLYDGKNFGITSWSVDCASDTFPTVYARISSVYNWIKTVTDI